MTFLPFRHGFGPAIRSGEKTMTCRSKRYGKPGDVLATPFGDVELLEVFEIKLGTVAALHFKEEGVPSSQAFIDIWDEIHPRKRFNPATVVWAHRFRYGGHVDGRR